VSYINRLWRLKVIHLGIGHWVVVWKVEENAIFSVVSMKAKILFIVILKLSNASDVNVEI
jgi:hypothetical protein